MAASICSAVHVHSNEVRMREGVVLNESSQSPLMVCRSRLVIARVGARAPRLRHRDINHVELFNRANLQNATGRADDQ